MRWAAAFLAFALAVPGAARAQPTEDATVHYAVKPAVTLFSQSDTTAPYVTLGLREQVFVLENGGRWALVRTSDGARGLVRADDLSNTWVRVSKSRQTVFLYRGARLVKAVAADLGTNFFSDKEKRGGPDEPDHWRTPEGVFFVANKNARSQYHKAFVLNYPNAEDAVRGLQDSLITAAEYEAILRAESDFSMPPMGTGLGGWIEIHGDGTGRRMNWTQGCIAIENEAIDQIWDWVHVGTPVIIEP